MPNMPIFIPIFYACDDCITELELTLGDYCKRLADASLGHLCFSCNEVKPDPPTTYPPYGVRAAANAAAFIQAHGIDAHVTLTHMVRALDGYTYRDANNMLCQGADWQLLDPTQTDIIYEFLGY